MPHAFYMPISLPIGNGVPDPDGWSGSGARACLQPWHAAFLLSRTPCRHLRICGYSEKCALGAHVREAGERGRMGLPSCSGSGGECLVAELCSPWHAAAGALPESGVASVPYSEAALPPSHVSCCLLHAGLRFPLGRLLFAGV
jgi:hypothetical protein